MTTKMGYGLRVCFDLAYADKNNVSPGKKGGSFKNKTAAGLISQTLSGFHAMRSALATSSTSGLTRWT